VRPECIQCCPERFSLAGPSSSQQLVPARAARYLCFTEHVPECRTGAAQLAPARSQLNAAVLQLVTK
jgi:hypothetical protein